jgi:uncharacterized protein YbjT (DUF2867 family)
MQTDPSNDNKPILVTGATGRQGGTGRAVLSYLLDLGFPVRALVRSVDERAAELERLGAEVVVGDFTNYGSLVAALEGVESAYFCYPVGVGITEAAGLFATAGRKQGLRRIVDLSLAATRPDSPSPQGRAQWVVEQLFEWAGFEGVHLRIAAFFMENVTLIDGPGIRAQGRIANSFGDKKLTWISGADVGTLAACLLANPALYTERVLVAGGVELLTYEQLAASVAAGVGRTVRYEELTPAAWRQELVDASIAAGAPNERGADHLVAQSVALRNVTLHVTDHLRQLAGRNPILFEQFVQAHRKQLTPV